MNVKHIVEKPDVSIVFQGILEGKELAFVIEMGMDAIIAAGAVPFVAMDKYNPASLHEVPDQEQ